MGKLTDLLTLARERAEALELPYNGALTPAEAYAVWQLAPEAIIIDVRTQAELDWVGRVPNTVEIEWSHYPEGTQNPRFLNQLQAHFSPETLLMFLCRSGGRSDYAARVATDAGYTHCYNILEGFEGNRDANGQRNKTGGWRYAGLPWYQG